MTSQRAPRNHSASRTTAEWVQWAEGEGFKYIVEKKPDAEAPQPGVLTSFHFCATLVPVGKVYCTLCAKHITASNCSLKQHCVGYPKQGKLIVSEHAKKAEKKGMQTEEQQPISTPAGPPIIVQVSFLASLGFVFTCVPTHQVQCPIKAEVEAVEEPRPAKKAKVATLDNFVAKGNKQEEFVKDLVTAFAAANIPFEKLKKRDDGTSPLLRQFLDKYIRLDGDLPNIPDPDNLRRTHLPKVKESGGLRNASISL